MAASLGTYRQKRNFAATSEPQGNEPGSGGDSFVIQKHDARRLHYDFRLEMDGVLKSWAVTKGPSLVPGEKRLAVHVEDHPAEYGDFEGTIPKGEYGGGSVIVWDRGRWRPVGDAHQGYAKGHLEFTLEGEKLKGRWHLIRMRGKPREKRENWLLVKGDDDYARTPADPDILAEAPQSVKTGRDVEELAGEAPGWSSRTGKIEKTKPAMRKKAAKKTDPADPPDVGDLSAAKSETLPDFVAPALASLAKSPPAGAEWLHEIKFDGYRLQVRIEAGQVKLLTRSGLDWTRKFGADNPAAVKALPVKSALLDGELVVENGTGASDFSSLQADLSEGRFDRFLFYAFDLLHLDGRNLRPLPLEQRKAALKRLLAEGSPFLRYSEHFEESGALVLRHACRLSLEGVVSKRRGAAYRSGRGRNWIKSKCSDRQEFVIGGYVPSSTSRRAIGSLVLGVYRGEGLEHVGRVGTGFSAKVAEQLFERLEAVATPDSPFTGELSADEKRQVHFVKPELVAEVEFRAWTAQGHLRHAAFRGLREDKPAREIVREAPAASGAAVEQRSARRTVTLTHPDRVYWPAEGVTKEGLADYYSEVWRRMAPFIVGRPLALLRCPQGIGGQKFFQKHAWNGQSRTITQILDPREPKGEPLIAINDLDGLIGLVQGAALEIHPWGSTVSDWEHPDMIILDLDPGEGVAWQAVIDAAVEVRRRLEAAGLAAFVKTSGGKGLHVVAPLKPKATWPAAKAFTKALAEAMAAESPELYVATIAKSKRRGKILVDYLRNQRGATAVAPYSTRARPGAAISMPLGWDELGPDIGPAYFTVNNVPARLAALAADPWQDFRASARPLEVTPPAGRKRR